MAEATFKGSDESDRSRLLSADDTVDGTVILSVVRNVKMFAYETLGPNKGAAALDQWILNPTNSSARHRRLNDRVMEFLRINGCLIGIKNKFDYGASVRDNHIQDILI